MTDWGKTFFENLFPIKMLRVGPCQKRRRPFCLNPFGLSNLTLPLRPLPLPVHPEVYFHVCVYALLYMQVFYSRGILAPNMGSILNGIRTSIVADDNFKHLDSTLPHSRTLSLQPSTNSGPKWLGLKGQPLIPVLIVVTRSCKANLKQLKSPPLSISSVSSELILW